MDLNYGIETDRLQASPPPRAFAQGTGVLLQVVGVALFLLSGCLCATSGLWDPILSRGQVITRLEQGQTLGAHPLDLAHHPGATGVMLTVMCATVGGVAMAGFGLGLQSDQPRAAWGATITEAILFVILIIAGGDLWLGDAPAGIRVWHAVLTVAVAALLGFTVAALKQVRAHPPPPGPNTLPKDFEIPSMYDVHH